MEKYYEKIKLRMVGELILAIILIPVAIYTSYVYFHMDAPLSGNDVLDFFGGFVNGVRSSLIAGFIIYLTSLFIRDIKAVRQESRLKELFIAEHDERLININETASRLSFHIILYVIIVAALIWGCMMPLPALLYSVYGSLSLSQELLQRLFIPEEYRKSGIKQPQIIPICGCLIFYPVFD